MNNKDMFPSILVLLLVFCLANPSMTFSQDYYEQGVAELNAGNWATALNIWSEGRNVLSDAGEVDPRIAFSFIETVTELNLKHFYVVATEIYYWGLSKPEFGSHKDVYEKEIARVKELIKPNEAKEWEQMYENNDASVLMHLRGFWVENDPTPTTPANERLLEHWERIAAARKLFDLRNTEPYGTDDRGKIYIKYGSPLKRKAGTMGSNVGVMRMWASRIQEAVDSKMSTQDVPMHPRTVLTNINDILKMIEQEDVKSDYDLWLYAFPGEKDYVTYIFGRQGGMGGFREVHSIEEFIPSAAFNKSRSVLVKNRAENKFEIFLPGNILQLVYYEELIPFSDEYADRYDDLWNEWMNALSRPDGSRTPPQSKVRAKRGSFLALDRNNPIKKDAPGELSVYDDAINPIHIIPAHFRYLDASNEPKLAVINVSIPTGIIGDYTIENHLIIRDESWVELDRVSDRPATTDDNLSLFVVNHVVDNLHYTVASTARTTDVGKENEAFIGKTVLEPDAPLSTDVNELEVSDLLIGVNPGSDLKTDKYPFSVLPATQIFKGDNLTVYLEVYHLLLGAQNKAQFEVEFKLEYEKERRFRRNQKEIISQTFNYDSSTPTSKQVVTFDLKDLEAGEYDFTVEIRDKLSGQTKKRFGKIEITE